MPCRRLAPAVLALSLTLGTAGCATPAANPPGASPPVPTADVLVLGEVHDNAEGHGQRLALLSARVEAGWRPAIAMEQFDRERQADLDRARHDCADALCVVRMAAPVEAGWQWQHYAPAIELALRYDLPLLAANLSRADASMVVKDGFAAALPAALIARYRLDALPARVLAAQEREVRDSHCGMLPDALVAPMAKAQIARDVAMTDIVQRHAASGVVLLAGNGHVRRDIGVPYWLRTQGLTAISIGFVETAGDSTQFDQSHVVAAAKRPDPCARFKAPIAP